MDKSNLVGIKIIDKSKEKNTKNAMFFFEDVLNMFFSSCFKPVLNSLTTLVEDIY